MFRKKGFLKFSEQFSNLFGRARASAESTRVPGPSRRSKSSRRIRDGALAPNTGRRGILARIDHPSGRLAVRFGYGRRRAPGCAPADSCQHEERLRAESTWGDSNLVFATKKGGLLEPRQLLEACHSEVQSSWASALAHGSNVTLNFP